MSLSSHAAQILRPSHAVTCQALLLAMDKIDPASREDSRLADVRQILEALPGRSEDLERLAQLEAATTTHAWTKVSVVATSITGQSEIRRFLTTFHEHVRELDHGVREILERKYPTSRSRALHATLQTMLWSTVASYYVTGNAPPDLVHGFLEALGVSLYVTASLGYVYFENVFVPRKFKQLDFQEHLQKIEHCLATQCERRQTVDIMSGSLRVPAQFHSQVMSRSESQSLKKNLEATADVAELGAVSPIDLVFRELVDRSQWERQIERAIEGRLYAPGSPTRNVEYDSVFYIDQTSGEPKLLLFYRSYRQEPKKKPPPDRDWQWAAEPEAG